MITLRDYGHKVWWFVPATVADRYAVSCECGEIRCANWEDAIKASEHWPNTDYQTLTEPPDPVAWSKCYGDKKAPIAAITLSPAP